MKKVAIYGGAFDPPHIGHTASVKNLFNLKLADEVWLVPSGNGRYDKLHVAAAVHRQRMLELLIAKEFQNDPKIKLELSQLNDSANQSFTMELLDQLKVKHRNIEFYFVIGADNLDSLKAWREAERLISENKFIVLPRNSAKPSFKRDSFIYLSEKEGRWENISSSQIRKLIKERAVIKGQVPDSVISYITDHKLYS